MAIFPKIQSPCPYKGDLSAIMTGDMCRLCNRQVIDITSFSDAQRVALVEGCADEVCVSYRFPVRAAAAAAMLAAAALSAPMSAAAQDAPSAAPPLKDELIVMGGIIDPANVQYVSDKDDRAVPELPVVYESGSASTGPATTTTEDVSNAAAQTQKVTPAHS